MKKVFRFLVIFHLLFNFHAIYAQRVGLVLSGGGAKGMTHVGVIKALEENEIPIDYVAGTSMGAIIGGMYAMGMSSDDMIELLKSEDFKRWSTGAIEQKYIYYYKNADPVPSFLDLRFKVNYANGLDSLRIKPIFPTNMVSPVQMNYAFLELFGRANAQCDGNFDNLFIPFRCVASDIYKKEAVIFKNGDLGDAIRASMSFPFVFKPIEVDGRLLFDGGMFNNFPVDVMQSHFKPDFIFGSVVATNPDKPTTDNIYLQMQTMVMNYTEYNIPEKDGLLVRFDMRNENLFDFSKVDEFVELGYSETMKRMEEIKKRVGRSVSKNEINEKREKYKETLPQFNFQNIYVVGTDSLQEQYIKLVFKEKEKKTFDLKSFKKSYFELISDEKIFEIIPHAQYNKNLNNYDLHLKVKIQDHFKALIGGNISSTTSNQAYVGLVYQNLNEIAQTVKMDAQFGTVYNGASLGARFDVPTKNNLYLKANMVFHRYSYYENTKFFYQEDNVSYFSQNEMYVKMRLGFPLTLKGRFEFGFGYAALNDRYIQDKSIRVENRQDDRSTYSLGSVYSQIESYTLDKVMYPTAGYNISATLQGIVGQESFKSVNRLNTSISGKQDKWIQFKAKYEQYFPLGSKFTMGAHAELAMTSRKLLDNYTATIIQAPAFEPTPHSKTIFNDAYSANKFVAVGVKPIFAITNSLYLRNETYGFLPYQSIYRRPDNTAGYSLPFSSYQFMSETSLVFDIFKVASVSVFVNYYSSYASPWNFGINIGSLLFNDKFLK